MYADARRIAFALLAGIALLAPLGATADVTPLDKPARDLEIVPGREGLELSLTP